MSWSEWSPWTTPPGLGYSRRTRKCTTEGAVEVGEDNCSGESEERGEPEVWVEKLADIVATFENGIYESFPSTKLIDGLGLDGNFNSLGCAVSHGDRVPIQEWFSLELDRTQTVAKVQIARRMDYTDYQGRHVRITVGPSREDDPSEPLCLPEIDDLQHTRGLVDYVCTEQVEGKYVKIFSTDSHLTICEAKVFIRVPAVPGMLSSVIGYHLDTLYWINLA